MYKLSRNDRYTGVYNTVPWYALHPTYNCKRDDKCLCGHGSIGSFGIHGAENDVSRYNAGFTEILSSIHTGGGMAAVVQWEFHLYNYFLSYMYSICGSRVTHKFSGYRAEITVSKR